MGSHVLQLPEPWGSSVPPTDYTSRENALGGPDLGHVMADRDQIAP